MRTMLRGWRTWIINGLMAIMPILELSELVDVLPDEWLPWYSLAMVLVNMWLRWITVTPIGNKH